MRRWCAGLCLAACAASLSRWRRVPDDRGRARAASRGVIDEICRVVITARRRAAALRRAGRADRLDGDRGRRSLSDRHWPGRRCDEALAREAAAVGGPARPCSHRWRAIARRQRKLTARWPLAPARASLGAAAHGRGRRAGRALVPRRAAAAHLRERPAPRRPAQLAAARRLDIWLTAPAPSRARSVSASGERSPPAGLHGRPRRPADPQGKLRSPPSSARSSSSPSCARHPPRRPRPDRPRRQPDRSPNEPDLLPATAAELGAWTCAHRGRARRRLSPSASPRTCPTPARLIAAANRRLAAHQPPAGALSRRIEGRISHLKRRYGLRRSRLRPHGAPPRPGRSSPTPHTLAIHPNITSHPPHHPHSPPLTHPSLPRFPA